MSDAVSAISSGEPRGTFGGRRLLSRPLYLQIAALVAICLCAAGLAFNVRSNMASAGIPFGFGFLDKPAGFRIGESLIAYAPSDSYARALLVGLVNTLRVAAIGCVVATILGALVGVARLSKNPLLAKLSAWYVELLRNTPLLLQLVLWHALILRLPPVRGALHPAPGVYLSQRGLQIPAIEFGGALWPIAAALALACCFAVFDARRLRRRRELTGRARPAWLLAVPLLVGLPVTAVFLTGSAPRLSVPELRGFNFVGGLTLTPEYAALLFGLIIYTSAFVAEIVRSGIQSVANGQWEAARALGLRDGRILRLIVIPQALRVITPPMTNQYLNLTKNSSLAVVIGYPEFASVANTLINQTGHAIEVLLIFMSVYLTLSLITSIAMNQFNARVALKERA